MSNHYVDIRQIILAQLQIGQDNPNDLVQSHKQLDPSGGFGRSLIVVVQPEFV